MIDISLNCLSAEFALLKPSVVFITDMASNLRPFVQPKLNLLDARLNAVFQHPNQRPVRHWSKR